MSNFHNIGAPSSAPWEQYSSTPAPQAAENTSLPTPTADQPALHRLTHVSAGQRPVTRPHFLGPGSVRATSTGWLQRYLLGPDAQQDERVLAQAIVNACGDRSLRLGRWEAQTNERARYGKQLEGSLTLVADFRPVEHGQFGLLSAGLWDSDARRLRAFISASSAMRPPFSAAVSETAQPVAAQRIFTEVIRQSIGSLVGQQFQRWDQQDVKTLIERKLGSESAQDHQLLLQTLTNRLSGQTSEAKLDVVQVWADEKNLTDAALATRDTRHPAVRSLEERLERFLNNPAFLEPQSKVFALLTPDSRNSCRKSTASANETGTAYYRSPLYGRIFKDKRGPIVALEEIYELIHPMQEVLRHQAILDWTPLTD